MRREVRNIEHSGESETPPSFDVERLRDVVRTVRDEAAGQIQESTRLGLEELRAEDPLAISLRNSERQALEDIHYASENMMLCLSYYSETSSRSVL